MRSCWLSQSGHRWTSWSQQRHCLNIRWHSYQIAPQSLRRYINMLLRHECLHVSQVGPLQYPIHTGYCATTSGSGISAVHALVTSAGLGEVGDSGVRGKEWQRGSVDQRCFHSTGLRRQLTDTAASLPSDRCDLVALHPTASTSEPKNRG